MTDTSVDLRTYSGEIHSHRHDHAQLVLPYRGKLEIEVEGRGGLVMAGLGVFIAAGAWQSFRSTGMNAFVVLDARPVPDLVISTTAGTPSFPITAPVQGLLDYVTATLPDRDWRGTLPAAWTDLLLDSLLRDRTTPAGKADRAASRAMAFMRAQASKAIRVADIAAAAGLSETRLHVLFRERLGTSPHAALAEIRLDAACRLLTGTDLSVADIAVRTGHADQTTLTKRLRRRRGVTPAAFRREARGR